MEQYRDFAFVYDELMNEVDYNGWVKYIEDIIKNVRDRKIGEIVARIERSGLVIERMEMTTLERATVEEHYAHLADKPFFGSLCDFMTSGPVVKMVVSGLSAVSKMRTLMGATNPLDAAPGTIRGDFAVDVNANVIHGSDCLENAEIEIKRFFG